MARGRSERLKGADQPAPELRFRAVLRAGLGDTPHPLRQARVTNVRSSPPPSFPARLIAVMRRRAAMCYWRGRPRLGRQEGFGWNSPRTQLRFSATIALGLSAGALLAEG